MTLLYECNFQHEIWFLPKWAYRHDVPVADSAAFVNTATGGEMAWFAVNDYDDFYYYDAYYEEFYDGTDYDKVGFKNLTFRYWLKIEKKISFLKKKSLNWKHAENDPSRSNF